MPECFYYKNGKKINDMQDLIMDFLKDNYQLKNASIFSSDDMQQGTVDILKGIPKYKMSEGGSKIESIPMVRDFITKENGLFKILGITNSNRLVPEYKEENRIYHYVQEHLKDIERLPDNLDVSNLKYSENKLRTLRENHDLDNISDNKLAYLLDQIESIIEFENKTKDFGNLLHNIVALKVQDRPYKEAINTFVNDPENKDIIGESNEGWVQKIDDITDSIINKVKKSGEPLSELTIVSDIVKGKLDLVTVDLKGDADIFEIKVSKNKYEDWDSAKLLDLDWQLALYRQLLGQHIDVDSTQLNVIPVWFGKLGDPNAIYLEDFVNRNSAPNSGLNSTGAITLNANKILPRKIMASYDPDREKILKEHLEKLIPGYKVQTDNIEDYDIEKIMNAARKYHEKTGLWQKANPYEGIPGVEDNYIKADTEEEFRSKIEKYVSHVKLIENKNVSTLKDALISAIKNNQNIKTSHNPKKDVTLNHLLNEFLNNKWDVITQIPEATPMGLIVLKNRQNGDINIISLSTNNFYAKSKIENTNYGDLEYYKSMLFVNEFKDKLFPGGVGKLSQIILFNTRDFSNYYRNVYGEYNYFRDRMHKMGLGDDLRLTENDIAGIEDIAWSNLDTNWRNFSGPDKEKIEQIFSPIRDTNMDMADVKTLENIQKEFFKAFPEYSDMTVKSGLDFQDDKQCLLALLQTAIVSKSELIPEGDFQRLSNFSLGFSDFKSLLSSLFTENQEDYDREGKRIHGLVQGLVWTTPDWVNSKDLRNINMLIDRGINHVRAAMQASSERFTVLTLNYYKEMGYSRTQNEIIGNSQSKYENLWLHDKNGAFSREFKTKNPYITDLENSLKDPERRYLQHMLLAINGYKLDISEKDLSGLDPESLSSISKNSKINKAISDGSYFEMPLVRREDLSKYVGAIKDPSKAWKAYSHDITYNYDPRGLQKEDILQNRIIREGYYEMYDIYGRQTKEYKQNMLERHPVEYFEFNLDTIANKIAFSKIKKGIFDKILPVVNAYMWWMKMLAGRQNEDISKQLDYAANQMKLAVYDEPLINEEFKNYATAISVVQSIDRFGILAFKPISIIRDISVGLFKNISYATTGAFTKGDFDLSDVMEAYKKLTTIDHKFSSEFNLIDEINHFYGMSDMGASSLADKLKTDRRGVLQGIGRYAYIPVTYGDYYNRMAVMLAKMIHDGSYEAHSIKDGIFTYDPKKDKRFSYYLANREKYTKNGEYVPATDDLKYNTQRRQYLLLVDQLNKEFRIEGKHFTEKELVPQAYSSVERTNWKTLGDMTYGYYEKESKAQVNSFWWGMTFLQFMQYWPGKMKQWFAKPTEYSPMGKIEQDFVIENGEKKLLYWETYEDENGMLQKRTTQTNTSDPVIIWKGSPYEGLMYSVFGTLKDIAKLDFKDIKNHEERNRRCLFALADGALIFILLGITAKILEGIIEEKGKSGLSGTVLGFSDDLNKKILSQYNIWESTFGAINTEPLFLSWGKRFSSSMKSVLDGNTDITDALSKNTGFAEVMNW